MSRKRTSTSMRCQWTTTTKGKNPTKSDQTQVPRSSPTMTQKRNTTMTTLKTTLTTAKETTWTTLEAVVTRVEEEETMINHIYIVFFQCLGRRRPVTTTMLEGWGTFVLLVILSFLQFVLLFIASIKDPLFHLHMVPLPVLNLVILEVAIVTLIFETLTILQCLGFLYAIIFHALYRFQSNLPSSIQALGFHTLTPPTLRDICILFTVIHTSSAFTFALATASRPFHANLFGGARQILRITTPFVPLIFLFVVGPYLVWKFLFHARSSIFIRPSDPSSLPTSSSPNSSSQRTRQLPIPLLIATSFLLIYLYLTFILICPDPWRSLLSFVYNNVHTDTGIHLETPFTTKTIKTILTALAGSISACLSLGMFLLLCGIGIQKTRWWCHRCRWSTPIARQRRQRERQYQRLEVVELENLGWGSPLAPQIAFEGLA
ncbi:hypothetical protein D9758_002856 [Tetrapyrgos nigripes]|uniref:Uncharacterized protein n=1 Tax=Tetrapyrgos nigripes TaxID=182062 RepID=A0A8H5GPX4_9AGAR|nr:hypothetical protein D9758_002856 [Tetrapyrgos nigripes]